MGLPDASIIASASKRGIITEEEAAALIQAASSSAPSPPLREDTQPGHSEDGRLAASAHWLPPVPTGQPAEMPGTPVEVISVVPAPREISMSDEPMMSISASVQAAQRAVKCVNDVGGTSDEHSPDKLGVPRPTASVNRFSSARKSTRFFNSMLRGTAVSAGSVLHRIRNGQADVREHLMRGRYGSLVMGKQPKNWGYSTGICGAIASSKHFDSLTMFVITLNALWIGVDIELNTAATWLDADLIFQIADNSFCVFFTFEVLVRFLAMSKKAKCLELSFIFDVALVLLMIVETWVMAIVAAVVSGDGAGQGLRQLSILRLLRLLRLTRMGRLMKMIPELMTLIKGMLSALRSVATTLVFLVSILWIFGIIFVQVYKEEQDNELFEFFGRLGISMVTLFVNGTLLDDLNVVANLLKDDSMILLTVFFIFVLISSMTLLNMLIGVLTQGVSDTASEERERLSVSEATRILQEVFHVVDINGDEKISKEEFESMISDHGHHAVQALTTLGINEDRLLELSRQLFEDEDADIEVMMRASRMTGDPRSLQRQSSFNHTNWVPKDLSFVQFIDELILLKPGNSVSVRDVMGLRRRSSAILRTLEELMTEFRKELEDVSAKHGQKLEHRARSSKVPESVGTAVEQMVPLGKLSGVPTELLFDELHRRLRTRPQRSWEDMDAMHVESMP